MKQKILTIAIILNFAFISIFTTCVAAERLPLPRGTKRTGSDQIASMGHTKSITFYETNLQASEVIRFFNRELPNRGFNKIAGGEDSASFLKGETMYMILVSPSASPEERTSFKVIEGAASIKKMPSREQKCPQVPSVPIYPDATCIHGGKMQSRGSLAASYKSDASIDDILDYYYNNMQQYGWRMKSEIDVNDLIASDNNPHDLGIDLGNSKALTFINQAGATCVISVMKLPMTVGTMISYIYREK